MARFRFMSEEVESPANRANLPALAAADRTKVRRQSYKEKERLRGRMRKLLGRSMELLSSQLEDALEAIEAGAPSPIPLKELVQTAELLARYGVGTEDTKEVTQDVTKRYVVRLPQRKARPMQAIATLDGTPLLPSGDYESHPEPGDSP
jgi:hypothetical protein